MRQSVVRKCIFDPRQFLLEFRVVGVFRGFSGYAGRGAGVPNFANAKSLESLKIPEESLGNLWSVFRESLAATMENLPAVAAVAGGLQNDAGQPFQADSVRWSSGFSLGRLAVVVGGR